MLSASLHRFPDPTTSRDPQIRSLVAQLATLEAGPAPRAHFRAELRAQLVAVTPRLVADGPTETDVAGARPAKRATAAGTDRAARTRAAWSRPLTAIACTIVVLAMLLGGAVWLSRDALPGDMLYGLKRAGENLQNALAPDDVARAKDELDQASTRYDEVRSLLGQPSAMALGAGPQAAGSISGNTASLVRSTLGSADDDIRNAMQTLGGTAVHDRSPAPLQIVIDWAPDEVHKLGRIVARIPAGSLHQRAGQSLDLLRAAQARASALEADLGCGCLTGGASDALGPVPCSTACSAPASAGNPAPGSGSAPTSGTAPTAPGSGLPSPPVRLPSGPQPGHTTTPPGAGSGAPRPGTSPSGSGSTSPGGILPSLPLPTGLPSLLPSRSRSASGPAPSSSSCAIDVNVGPIHIGLGSCSPGG